MVDDKFQKIIQALKKGEQPVVNVDTTNNQGFKSSQRGNPAGLTKSTFGLKSVNEGLGSEHEEE